MWRTGGWPDTQARHGIPPPSLCSMPATAASTRRAVPRSRSGAARSTWAAGCPVSPTHNLAPFPQPHPPPNPPDVQGQACVLGQRQHPEDVLRRPHRQWLHSVGLPAARLPVGKARALAIPVQGRAGHSRSAQGSMLEQGAKHAALGHTKGYTTCPQPSHPAVTQCPVAPYPIPDEPGSRASQQRCNHSSALT